MNRIHPFGLALLGGFVCVGAALISLGSGVLWLGPALLLALDAAGGLGGWVMRGTVNRAERERILAEAAPWAALDDCPPSWEDPQNALFWELHPEGVGEHGERKVTDPLDNQQLLARWRHGGEALEKRMFGKHRHPPREHDPAEAAAMRERTHSRREKSLIATRGRMRLLVNSLADHPDMDERTRARLVDRVNDLVERESRLVQVIERERAAKYLQAEMSEVWTAKQRAKTMVLSEGMRIQTLPARTLRKGMRVTDGVEYTTWTGPRENNAHHDPSMVLYSTNDYAHDARQSLDPGMVRQPFGRTSTRARYSGGWTEG